MRRGLHAIVAVLSIIFGNSMPVYAQDVLSTGQPLAVLLAAGDISKCGSKGKDEATAKLLMSEINLAKKNDIKVHVLALGDLAYDSGTAADFVCFEKSWGRQEIYSLLLPVPGNHEYEKHADAKPYFDFFANLPVVAENRARGGYYALELPAGETPAWRIYALNSYAGVGASSAQVKWLERDLVHHQTPCVLAFWHPFLFSSGHHGHRRSKNPRALTHRESLMVEPFKALYRQGATVILTAHDHDFEQFGRHNVDGEAQQEGIRSFVIGTGGGPLYRTVTYARRAPNSEAYDQDNHGVLRIELYQNSYRWSFLPIEGGKAISLLPNEDRCNIRRPN